MTKPKRGRPKLDAATKQQRAEIRQRQSEFWRDVLIGIGHVLTQLHDIGQTQREDIIRRRGLETFK